MQLDPGLLTAVGSAAGLIVLDAVVGVAVAAKSHTFDSHKLPDFIVNLEAPLVAGLGGTVLQGLSSGVTAESVAGVVVAVTAVIAGRALADIRDKVSALLG